MKKIILMLAAFLCFLNVSEAQRPKGKIKDKIESHKIAFLTERLDLSQEEAQGFWPLYNQYRDELEKIKGSRIPEKPVEELTDAEAEKVIAQELDAEARQLDLRREYYQKFKKVISPRKIAMLFKAEMEFKGKLLKEIQRRRDEKRGR